ncbi:MAG: LapA family protein [Steroidobacteraceae bacterium]
MSRTKFFLLLILVLLLAMGFVALNPQMVVTEFAVVQVQLRLGVVLIIALALGLIIGVLLRVLWVAELLRERGRLRRALRVAESKARAMANTESDR